jgi:hypothetical protein
MTSNEELFKRIRESIQSAKKTLKLKDEIEKEMSVILDELKNITGNEITIEVEDNDFSSPYASSEKVVYISKSGYIYGESFVLFGFSINKDTGYPVDLETDKNLYNCYEESTLKICIGDIISSEANAMKIVSIASSPPIFPF